MREIKANEFACRMKSLMYEQHAKFTFFLGAGCSISSGILGASGMVRDWLRRLKIIKKMNDEQFREWTLLKLPNFTDDIAATYYGIVMEELFFSPQERQTEIEHLIEGKDPGFGYAILAQLITHDFCGKYCNLVLTTNFDDLVADALYLYTNKKPLNIPHESLIGFAKMRDFRPTIIKVHGDARLAPLNTEVEISNIDEKLKETLKTFFSDTALVFIGYGGNDKSILDTLSEIPAKDLPNLIFWVNDRIPENEFGVWLRDHNAIWVNHLDFDELMLLVKFEFKLPLPQNDRFEKLINSIGEKFTALQSKIFMLSESPEKEVLVEAAQKTAEEFKDWWSVELEATKFKRNNKEQANNIYLEGIKKFEDSSELLGSYALFLDTIMNDYNLANEYYLRAIDVKENDATNLCNYAIFLQDSCSDYINAEYYYKKSTEVNPNYINALLNYANYLWGHKKDYIAAENYFERAFNINPEHPYGLSNYGSFLADVKEDYKLAEEYLVAAIKSNPDKSICRINYANFLAYKKNDYKMAQIHYLKAIEINPENPRLYESVATFYHLRGSDRGNAEKLYRKAIELNPKQVTSIANLAGILLSNGKFPEGFSFIDNVLTDRVLAKSSLIAECHFYYYAHSTDEAKQQKSLSEIKRLLANGVKSKDWDLSPNVARAIEDGHPEPEFLKALADVICDRAPIESLDKFEVWTNIQI